MCLKLWIAGCSITYLVTEAAQHTFEVNTYRSTLAMQKESASCMRARTLHDDTPVVPLVSKLLDTEEPPRG